jgi:hypothetical protein
MRVQYRRTPDGVELHFGESVASVSMDPTQQVRVSIPTSFVSDSLRFLGSLDGDQIDATIRPYDEVSIVQYASVDNAADEEVEEAVRSQRAREEFGSEGEGQAS